MSSIVTVTNSGFNRTYSSTLTRTSTFNHSSKPCHNLNVIPHIGTISKISNDSCYTPTSTYDNNTKITVGINVDKPRRSRQHDQWTNSNLEGHKDQVKRDLSMPPTNRYDQQYDDDNLFSQYSYGIKKYSIGDLEGPDDLELSGTDTYDSVVGSVSLTPPPVNMIHEYANRKAIIRPLAFRPVQSDRSHNAPQASPTKPTGFIKNKVSQVRRDSPPPVPPHTTRIPIKSSLARVQSLKSGDSSGYYSSRTVCTANGDISPTDISTTLEDNGSLMDSVVVGEIYANTMDLSNEYQPSDVTNQEGIVARSSFDAEIIIERERSKLLETALSRSDAELLNAESRINDLKRRLSHKSSEANNTKESLALVKRSLDHQTQKSHNLEKSIQSLLLQNFERTHEKVTKEKITQANLSSGDQSSNKLLDKFEEERQTWLDEKLKVLTYQKQIETNFQRLVVKCRRQESQLMQLKGQMREGLHQPPHQSIHTEDHEKSSTTSTNSSGRHCVNTTTRIESTEH